MWRKHSVRVKGKLLVYWTHGSLQLPKLLLLAPGGHDGTFYRNFAGALGSDYCLVAPDYPGRGGSDEQRFNTIKSLAKTLALWLEQLGWNDLTVLGISFGGAMANELARLQEKRIKKVILIATGEFSRPALRPLINMIFMPALVSAKVQRLYHRYIVTHMPVFNKNYPVRLPILLKQGRAILNYKLPKKVLSLPAVLIMLEDDPLVTRGSLRKLQHLYPNHIFTLLPVPHELPLKDEQYKIFFKVVGKHLRQITLPKAAADAVGLLPESDVLIETTKDGLLVRKNDAIEQAFGCLHYPGIKYIPMAEARKIYRQKLKEKWLRDSA